MIREIERPEIDFKFWIINDYRFYYDDKRKEYFIKTEYGSKYYFNLEGHINRIGKPAIEYFNGVKVWIENGRWNRLDGPAHIYYSNK